MNITHTAVAITIKNNDTNALAINDINGIISIGESTVISELVIFM